MRMALLSSSVSFCSSLALSSSPSLLAALPSSSSVVSTSTGAPPISAYPAVYCGRGDKRTAKGKRFRHSHGNSRPKNASKGRGLPPIPLPARAPKKDPLDDGEFIEIILDEKLFGKA